MFVFSAYLFLLFLLAAAMHGQTAPTAAESAPPSPLPGSADGLVPNGVPLIPIAPGNVPAMDEVFKQLQQPRCAVAVGGQFAEVVITRVTTTHHRRAHGITARKDSNGHVQVLYALAMEGRYVVLFDSFARPRDVTASAADAPDGTIQVDTLSRFEQGVGLPPGTLSVKQYQAVLLIHEQLHLNGLALADLKCFGASLLNTMYAMDACYPKIAKQSPMTAALANGDKTCLTCHSKPRLAKVMAEWKKRRDDALAKVLAEPGLDPALRRMIQRMRAADGKASFEVASTKHK